MCSHSNTNSKYLQPLNFHMKYLVCYTKHTVLLAHILSYFILYWHVFSTNTHKENIPRTITTTTSNKRAPSTLRSFTRIQIKEYNLKNLKKNQGIDDRVQRMFESAGTHTYYCQRANAKHKRNKVNVVYNKIVRWNWEHSNNKIGIFSHSATVCGKCIINICVLGIVRICIIPVKLVFTNHKNRQCSIMVGEVECYAFKMVDM